VKNTITIGGWFLVRYSEFFKTENTRENFCLRNKVTIEFPRCCNGSCKINIIHQYRQTKRTDCPYIKITANCENGHCSHEYYVCEESKHETCKMYFRISGIFLNGRIETPLHDIVASSPLKGKYREMISNDAQLKGPLRTYSEHWSEVKKNEINSLNYTSILSPNVVRNAGSERNSAHTLAKVKDAVELRKEHDLDHSKHFQD